MFLFLFATELWAFTTFLSACSATPSPLLISVPRTLYAFEETTINIQITKAHMSRELITLAFGLEHGRWRLLLQAGYTSTLHRYLTTELSKFLFIEDLWIEWTVNTEDAVNCYLHHYDESVSPCLVNDFQHKTFGFIFFCHFFIEWIKPKIISQTIAIN